ncbi:MAG: hypothetical protein KAG53_04735 [Endozoicomonadaceae bacterium]|nr:hypothetical protein [Endozoicomonadaceae bacterium]
MDSTSLNVNSNYSHSAPESKDAITGHTSTSAPDNFCFDTDSNGKPLSDRKLRKLSYAKWIVFNIKRCATTVVRTFMWLKVIIQIARNHDKNPVERIRNIRNMGGIMAKILQFIASHDDIISHVFSIQRSDEIFKKVKIELNKSMHDNDGMSISEITKIIDENGLEYDRSCPHKIKIVGTGTIASVVSIPMIGGGTRVVKVVNRNLEIKFLSDKTIISTLLKIMSILKPEAVGKGTVKAITMFLETISKEFDLRYELHNTITQKHVFDDIKQEINPFNITETDSCPCKASTHGPNSEQCHNYLENENRPYSNQLCIINSTTELYRLSIPIEIKVPNVDTKSSTRDIMVMEEIHGVPLSCTDEEFQTKIINPILNYDATLRNLFENNSDLARTLLKKKIIAFSYDVWEKGLYTAGRCSADMHNGNIMAAIENDELKIYHIDFGNHLSIDKDSVIALYAMQNALGQAINHQKEQSTTKSDHIDIIVDSLRQIGVSVKERLKINWDALKNDIVKTIDLFDENKNINTAILDIIDVAFAHDVYITASTIGLFRTRVLLSPEG